MFVFSQALNRADLAFFSGFVAGDGCFQIRENNAGTSWCCSLDVKLRADNTPLLAEFRSWSGAGELFAAAARIAFRRSARRHASSSSGGVPSSSGLRTVVRRPRFQASRPSSAPSTTASTRFPARST